MVLKPAEQTPLSALAVMVLAERVGLHPGVLSIVTGDAADAPLIGGEMTSNPIHRLHPGRQAADGAVREHGQEGLA